MSRQRVSKKAGKLKPKQRKAASKIEPRKLFLKFRVKPLVRMPKSVMFGKLRHFVKTGEAPDDLEVAYMSYDHKVGRKFQPGERLMADEQEELEKFYDVLLSMNQEDFNFEGRRGKFTKNPGPVRFERPE
jgi:hypothetical protein